MSLPRVVVTGMGGVTSLGDSWAEIEKRLRARQNAVQRMNEWDRYEMMHTRLAAPVKHFEAQTYYPRKMTRSMGRVSLLALRATELALQQAGLRNDPQISDGRMGIAYGSSSGSVDPVRVFGQMLENGSMAGVTSTSYIQMMPHTAAVNVGLYFGLKGRVIPTSSACTSGSQAIGYAFEDHPRAARADDGRRRRRGAVGAGRGGVRHAVRHQHQERRAGEHAAAVRQEARRPGGRRRRGDAGARGPGARQGARRDSRSPRSSASPPIPTASTSRSPTTSSRRAP